MNIDKLKASVKKYEDLAAKETVNPYQYASWMAVAATLREIIEACQMEVPQLYVHNDGEGER